MNTRQVRLGVVLVPQAELCSLEAGVRQSQSENLMAGFGVGLGGVWGIVGRILRNADHRAQLERGSVARCFKSLTYP